jgi:serine protease Do
MNFLPRRALRAIAAAAILSASAGAQTSTRDPGEANIIRAARQVSPAVVSVAAPGVGSGSGVIIRGDGIVVTNAHVVGNAPLVEVGLADGRTVRGRVLGRDPGVDIAVVRVEAENLPAASLGDSDRLEVGQTAIAIGNPIGLERTVTTGIISAINRSPRGFELGGLIQTDAAINPGNSGGPLLDSQGRVVGINSAILRGTTGLGFAIPINLARDIAEQVVETGRITRAYLGIVPAEIIPELAEQYDLPVREGIIVRGVGPGTPAARAGLRGADIIVRMNDTPIRTQGELTRFLREHRAGDVVRVGYVRLDERGRVAARATVNVRLEEAPVQ